MKLTGTSENMLAPETPAEAGMLAWLAHRFGGRPVTLVFDTTHYLGTNHYPMLWINRVDAEGDSANASD